MQPTGVNLSTDDLLAHRPFKHPLANALERQKAQNLLDVLMLLPFSHLYIHKLQLRLSIDKEYYKELVQEERYKNRAKVHEEAIGKRHVLYTFSPNGTVEIAVRSNDAPFRLAADEDESIIFSFFGQVRDRLLRQLNDIRERNVPPIMGWHLKACDLNKDIEMDEKAQLVFPDIQLRHADKVFRLYIKSLRNKTVCRTEESLALNELLPEALDNIRHPYKSIEETILKLVTEVQMRGSVRTGVRLE